MKRGPQVAHDSGRRRVVDRQRPRKSKRDSAEHTDKYAAGRLSPEAADLADQIARLARHFNGEEGHRG